MWDCDKSIKFLDGNPQSKKKVLKSFFQCLTFLTENVYYFAVLSLPHLLSSTLSPFINALSAHSWLVQKNHSFAIDSVNNLSDAHNLSKLQCINASNSPSFAGKGSSMIAVGLVVFN